MKAIRALQSAQRESLLTLVASEYGVFEFFATRKLPKVLRGFCTTMVLGWLARRAREAMTHDLTRSLPASD